ncbi:MAG: NAD-dependent epimerase/dehydratase family protein [Bacteroidia bacterium]|nr:NAD-dependent epimerase/dehydratase family protein [Bacteroidia bacterium]
MLVTGADGFIGSHLVEHLLAEGAIVRALTWYHPQQNWGWMEDVPPHERLSIVSGDIRDARACHGWLSGVDMVFHLAALIGIPYSYEAPESYLSTNISGTLNLLEACREHETRMIFMSTSEVYGTALQVPINEDHPLQPQSPYSATKIGAEALVRSYFYSFGLPVTIARVFNTYGPRQSARAIIPTIITQLAAGVPSLKLGDLRPTRDLVYVADTCRCLIAIASVEESIGKAVNICTGQDQSMQTVVDTIQQLMQVEVAIELDARRVRPEGSEVMRLCGDHALLRSLTGTSPSVSLEDGLQHTIDWFLDPRRYTQYKPDHYHV